MSTLAPLTDNLRNPQIEFQLIGDIPTQTPSLEQLLDTFASSQDVSASQPLEGVPPFEGIYNIDGLLFAVLNERVYEVQLITGTADFQIVDTNRSHLDQARRVLPGYTLRYHSEAKAWRLSQTPEVIEHSPNVRTTSLPLDIDALLTVDDIDILQHASIRYLQRFEKGAAGSQTLFERLFYEYLSADSSPAEWSEREILREALASEQASQIGNMLLSAIDWYGVKDGEDSEPEIIKQIVWAALMLELDPLEEQQIGYVAGFDLYGAANWGQSYAERRVRLENHLERKLAAGTNAKRAAKLAMQVLSPAIPDFFIEDIPDDLKYGTAPWVNFAHGVALANLIPDQPAADLSFNPLLRLPLQLSHRATEDSLLVIASARIAPTLQWAIANGVLEDRTPREYLDADIALAVAGLDKFIDDSISAVDSVFAEVPDRKVIALQEFHKIFGHCSKKELHTMIPTTVGDRFKYALKAPAPSAPPFHFALIDVFMAGYLVNGPDKFISFIPEDSDIGRPAHDPRIEELYGIDVPKIFDDAFSDYADRAKAGYSLIVENLFAQLPAEDRLALNTGKLNIYTLREDTGKTIAHEDARDQRLHRGRCGFIIECEVYDQRRVYEVFPLLGMIRPRMDLPKIDISPRFEQRPEGSRNIHRSTLTMKVDWATYSTSTLPRPDSSSEVIPSLLQTYPQTDEMSYALSTARFKKIATLIADKHLFFDRESTYNYYRRVTAIEHVENTYPPILNILEILVSGLSCLNASLKGQSTALVCTLDTLSLLGPALKFVSGALSVAAGMTHMTITRMLPAFAGWTSRSLRLAAVQYGLILNPALIFTTSSQWVSSAFYRGERIIEALILMSDRLRRIIPRARGGAHLLTVGLPTIIGTERPLQSAQVLGRVRQVPDVPIRHTSRTTTNSAAYHLVRPASGLAYGPQLVKTRTIASSLPPTHRVKTHAGYVQSPPSLPYPTVGKLGRQIDREELNAFLKQQKITTSTQKADDLRADITDGVPMHTYTKKNGEQGLVMFDVEDKRYLDVFKNGEVYFGETYNYRSIGTWRPTAEGTSGVVNVPLDKLVPTRPNLDPSKLGSIKAAFEEGIPLPPIKAQKVGNIYKVVDGHHRLNIAQQLELRSAPTLIVTETGY